MFVPMRADLFFGECDLSEFLLAYVTLAYFHCKAAKQMPPFGRERPAANCQFGTFPHASNGRLVAEGVRIIRVVSLRTRQQLTALFMQWVASATGSVS